MKRLTPCITGALMTSMAAWGCADLSDDGRSGRDDDWDSSDEVVPEASSGPGRSMIHVGPLPLPSCPTPASSSVASHIVIAVKWPALLAIAAGEGEVHVWTKADLTVQGQSLSGAARPCGSVIPAFTKASLLGGGQVQVEIPGSAWESPAMPVFQIRGDTSGFAVGSTISMEPIATFAGLTMVDPMNDPWPGQASLLTAVDHDGDGRPGVKSIPRTDSPFAAPPVDLTGVISPNGAIADEVDLAMRVVLSLDGTRDSCASAEGTAQVSRVDAHIVGCHVRGGNTCTRAQADFIDASLPRFDIQSATFEMVEVPANATCADVRAALPAR